MENNKSLMKVMLATLLIVVGCEFIGEYTVKLGSVALVLFPMLYAVIIGIIITPDLLGKKIKVLKEMVGEKEINIAGDVVGIALVLLGIKYGSTVGPNLAKIIQAGPAFLAQEFGHILAPIVALPLALLFGFKREAVGACSSISRETSLGVISEKYGINSPEGSGVLGTYLMGTVIGTIYFSILGSVSIYTGLHPYALGMATGVGSGSMMTAASAALTKVPEIAADPAMVDTILSYGATSNMMSSLTGLIFLVFITLPFTNKLYKVLEPKLGRKSKETSKNSVA
ncbi:DUF3100 domain-containing protein [Romboutsia sp. 1001216sp1]|uniref:DUF3100 domain-containing protein n=1 Tax=Romboutsia sp. 1001216sp1 TaxID=2986997 RepID=UPI00232C18E2|nr:DUF3100 domain-containing protein [Romboutsia sp. 1001216sp1]MDB8804393.1 DUF3100 domain-containing protein [Romboutsia sp. 1001216sp1]MDB8807648.1 DUF3100 domain-containing protein [Romboutsia sp. 1001216sp1]MDB8810040.1 DUF3100 domain-containing protein [Romboutsia sp. 1001216sp1]MDB8815789.1 DUF3100 domain-containing protein [Romboutsia sp. 1001216sp1]MDB8819363.1 DUF3100 domain-containing protein [Romboutsia sp. 1001216sp1]